MANIEGTPVIWDDTEEELIIDEESAEYTAKHTTVELTEYLVQEGLDTVLFSMALAPGFLTFRIFPLFGEVEKRGKKYYFVFDDDANRMELEDKKLPGLKPGMEADIKAVGFVKGNKCRTAFTTVRGIPLVLLQEIKEEKPLDSLADFVALRDEYAAYCEAYAKKPPHQIALYEESYAKKHGKGFTANTDMYFYNRAELFSAIRETANADVLKTPLNDLSRNDNSFRICVIDEEFENWQKAHPDGTEEAYMKAMSDETALRLLQKHGYDTVYTTCFLPIVLPFHMDEKEEHYKLDETAQKLLRRYLERIYGKDTVYVPGCIMSYDTAFEEHSRLAVFAKNFFEHGVSIRFAEWDTQPHSEDEQDNAAPYMPYYIPFVVKGTITNPLSHFEKPDFHLDPAAVISYITGDLAALGLAGVPDIHDTRIPMLLERCFGTNDFDLYEVPVEPALLPGKHADILLDLAHEESLNDGFDDDFDDDFGFEYI